MAIRSTDSLTSNNRSERESHHSPPPVFPTFHDETGARGVVEFCCAVGTEVVLSLVLAALTTVGPGTLEHLHLCHGRLRRPGARRLEFLTRGSTPAAQKERRWKFFTPFVPVWIFTKNQWWPVCVTWPKARSPRWSRPSRPLPRHCCTVLIQGETGTGKEL